MILNARFVVPVDGPPIEGGAVVIQDGLIVAVGGARELADRTAVDYGDAVVCPGMVNAHTHLELTHLAGRVPPVNDFLGWLRGLYAESISSPSSREQVELSIRQGVGWSLAAGVTTVGDITRHPRWTRPVLHSCPMRGVSLGEVIAIGTRRSLLRERLDSAASREHVSRRLGAGISPHAPYTVEPEGLRECARRAVKREASGSDSGLAGRSVLCIHAAETEFEDSFTRFRSGPLADYLRELGLWDDEIPISGCGPIELLDRCELLTSRTIVAHANYVTDDDIDLLARRRTSVAYCPRTHCAFGHPPHRFRRMLTSGVNVAVGTDSLASNPSLSVLDELRYLHRKFPELEAELLLRMGTLHGARALGLADRVGTLVPGKQADLVVFPLTRHMTWDDILETAADPLAVFVDGVMMSAC